MTNLPSFAARLDATLDVEDIGEITVDTTYGGDSFVIAEAAALGFDPIETEARELDRLGVAIADPANAQLEFFDPENCPGSAALAMHLCSPTCSVKFHQTKRLAASPQMGPTTHANATTQSQPEMPIPSFHPVRTLSYGNPPFVHAGMHCRAVDTPGAKARNEAVGSSKYLGRAL